MSPATRNRGFVLVTALVFMAVTMLLAIAATRQGTIQSQISSSQRMDSLAFGAAESALRNAETELLHAYANYGATGLVPGVVSWMYGADSARSNADLQTFRRGNRWSESGAKALPSTAIDFSGAVDATTLLPAQPRYTVEDLGAMRPAGSGLAHESGATGGSGYEGSAGMSPSGNSDLHVYRITGKALAPNGRQVRTLESTFAGRTRG